MGSSQNNKNQSSPQRSSHRSDFTLGSTPTLNVMSKPEVGVGLTCERLMKADKTQPVHQRPAVRLEEGRRGCVLWPLLSSLQDNQASPLLC